MSEIYGIIYKATNITNDKAYIGQTVKPLNVRISGHNRGYKCEYYMGT